MKNRQFVIVDIFGGIIRSPFRDATNDGNAVIACDNRAVGDADVVATDDVDAIGPDGILQIRVDVNPLNHNSRAGKQSKRPAWRMKPGEAGDANIVALTEPQCKVRIVLLRRMADGVAAPRRTDNLHLHHLVGPVRALKRVLFPEIFLLAIYCPAPANRNVFQLLAEKQSVLRLYLLHGEVGGVFRCIQRGTRLQIEIHVAA